MAGRKRKYGTAKALERAVDAYFASISYEVKAVVKDPTGEMGRNGRLRFAARTLQGVTETKWLRPPGMAGLMLHLGVSKETWSNYGKLEGYREVVERARARMEDYWTTRLDGKGSRGAKFALSCCYGWREGGNDGAEGRNIDDDDPITKSLKEAANALAKTDEDPPVAVHGEAGADL